MLQGLQDNYADAMGRVFPTLSRGIRGSKAIHTDTKKFYSIINNNNKEMDLETLRIKAAHEEMLAIENKHIKKTLKSFQRYKDKAEKAEEEKLQLLKEIEELKKNIGNSDNQEQKQELKQEQKQSQKKGISRKFSGKKI